MVLKIGLIWVQEQFYTEFCISNDFLNSFFSDWRASSPNACFLLENRSGKIFKYMIFERTAKKEFARGKVRRLWWPWDGITSALPAAFKLLIRTLPRKNREMW